MRIKRDVEDVHIQVDRGLARGARIWAAERGVALWAVYEMGLGHLGIGSISCSAGTGREVSDVVEYLGAGGPAIAEGTPLVVGDGGSPAVDRGRDVV